MRLATRRCSREMRATGAAPSFPSRCWEIRILRPASRSCKCSSGPVPMRWSSGSRSPTPSPTERRSRRPTRARAKHARRSSKPGASYERSALNFQICPSGCSCTPTSCCTARRSRSTRGPRRPESIRSWSPTHHCWNSRGSRDPPRSTASRRFSLRPPTRRMIASARSRRAVAPTSTSPRVRVSPAPIASSACRRAP